MPSKSHKQKKKRYAAQSIHSDSPKSPGPLVNKEMNIRAGKHRNHWCKKEKKNAGADPVPSSLHDLNLSTDISATRKRKVQAQTVSQQNTNAGTGHVRHFKSTCTPARTLQPSSPRSYAPRRCSRRSVAQGSQRLVYQLISTQTSRVKHTSLALGHMHI